MITLTNTAIAALQPGKELKDDRVPGLSVRAHQSGKSFMLYYRTRAGKVRRPKIGDCTVMSLSDAREVARQWLAQVAAGGDPAGGFAASRTEPDMDELWRLCERDHYNKDTAWDKEAKRIYTIYAKKRIGNIRVKALTYADVNGVHQAMKDEPFQANRMISVVSKMLNLAERWSLRDSGTNPCQHVERFAEKKRRRYATPAELGELGKLLDKYAEDKTHVSGVAFLYLLLFSGARPSEIENGTPDMLERLERVEGGKTVVYGVLRLDNGKTGERNVFLPPQAMAIMDKLPGKRTHLAGRPNLPRRLWRSLRKAIGCKDLWARDMRRTFATVGMSNGMSSSTLGELLGHSSSQTTKTYAKLMEAPAHQAAAATATAVEKMLNGAKTPEQRAAE